MPDHLFRFDTYYLRLSDDVNQGRVKDYDSDTSALDSYERYESFP